MAADPAPDDVGSGAPAGPVLERGSAVRCPRHLEDVVGALDSLHAQTRSEALAPQVGREVTSRPSETRPVSGSQRLPVAIETRAALPGGHSVERLEELVVRAVVRGSASRDVLGRLSFPCLPVLAPEPGL